MRAGTWTLTLSVLEPGNVATIEVENDPLGGTEPTVFLAEQTINFLWADGRRSFFPWSSLVDARFIPAEGNA